MTSAAPSATLTQILWPADTAGAQWLRRAALVAAGVAALWVSAKVQVPGLWVPTTMQMFVVMALGAAYGSRLAGATLLSYLAAGAAGWPVFAGTPEKGIGLVYMAGPTGGYLLGFLLAAMAVGALAERGWDRRWWSMALAMLAGVGIVHLFGTAWLAALIGAGKAFGVFTGFILVDLVKVALAVALFPAVWSLIGRKS